MKTLQDMFDLLYQQSFTQLIIANKQMHQQDQLRNQRILTAQTYCPLSENRFNNLTLIEWIKILKKHIKYCCRRCRKYLFEDKHIVKDNILLCTECAVKALTNSVSKYSDRIVKKCYFINRSNSQNSIRHWTNKDELLQYLRRRRNNQSWEQQAVPFTSNIIINLTNRKLLHHILHFHNSTQAQQYCQSTFKQERERPKIKSMNSIQQTESRQQNWIQQNIRKIKYLTEQDLLQQIIIRWNKNNYQQPYSQILSQIQTNKIESQSYMQTIQSNFVQNYEIQQQNQSHHETKELTKVTEQASIFSQEQYQPFKIIGQCSQFIKSCKIKLKIKDSKRKQ